MKKVFKILAISIGAILFVVFCIAIFINIKGIPKYQVAIPEYQSTSSPEIIARGKKLSLALCATCHADPKTGKLTGTQMLDAPKVFGTIYSRNITQDKTHGIGNWTDAELLYLLRTGLKPDGQYLPPYMAKLPLMADEDINAIIAFLRSDDPMMAADPTPDQDSSPSFVTKLLCNIAFKPFPMPEAPISMPDTTDRIELGKYLAYNLECFSCHSADFASNNYLEPNKSVGYFAGGNPTLNLEGQVIVTSNLTPHETGIKGWTEAEFVKRLRFGIKDGEQSNRYPMRPYTILTDHEAASIYQYLMTLEPIENQVDKVYYD